jgi:hypothetical protein
MRGVDLLPSSNGGRSTRPPRYTSQASLLHLEVLPYPGLRGEDGSGGIDHLIYGHDDAHAVPRSFSEDDRGTAESLSPSASVGRNRSASPTHLVPIGAVGG